MNEIADIFELAKTFQVVEGDSYILSYPYLLNYFECKEVISEADFVCGAHMVYGWMPTIVDLYLTKDNIDLSQAANLLTKARREGKLKDEEIDQLASVVNNSLVGASKLLHFVAPKHFAIWDTKIYSFIHHRKPHYYRMRQVERYSEYLTKLKKYQQDERFVDFHKIVNSQLGYSVSALRAIEVVMFQNSRLLVG